MSKRRLLTKLTALSLCLCSSTAMSACEGLGDIFSFMDNSSQNESVVSEQESVASGEMVSLSIPKQVVSLLPDAVARYLSASPEMLVTDFLPYGAYRDDQGAPFVLEYDLDTTAGLPDVKEIVVEFSFKEDFSVIEQTEVFKGLARDLKIYNLQTGKNYFVRMTAVLNSGVKIVATGEVETEPSQRFIRLEGGSNVRDIGGWTTEDGRTIKQGVLYRGGEIDGGKNTGHPDFCLTAKGIEQLRALGIRTDIDLRSESVKVSEYSVLGPDVNRKFYNAAQYQAILQKGNAERTRNIFSDLAQPTAYPAYLHCTHGVDRAGSTVLILQALLGVGKDDLIREYELSAFYYNYKHVNREMQNGGNILDLIEGLEGYEGATLAEKTANFLLSIGVTQEEIDSLRTIFLE